LSVPSGLGRGRGWPHETLIARDEGLPVAVTATGIKGASARLECRSEDGAIFEVHLRDGAQAAIDVAAGVRLRPARVFVFPDSDGP
jgi:hypothetical protein